MQWALGLEQANEAIARYLRCVFLSDPTDTKIKGRQKRGASLLVGPGKIHHPIRLIQP